MPVLRKEGSLEFSGWSNSMISSSFASRQASMLGLVVLAFQQSVLVALYWRIATIQPCASGCHCVERHAWNPSQQLQHAAAIWLLPALEPLSEDPASALYTAPALEPFQPVQSSPSTPTCTEQLKSGKIAKKLLVNVGRSAYA